MKKIISVLVLCLLCGCTTTQPKEEVLITLKHGDWIFKNDDSICEISCFSDGTRVDGNNLRALQECCHIQCKSKHVTDYILYGKEKDNFNKERAKRIRNCARFLLLEEE